MEGNHKLHSRLERHIKAVHLKIKNYQCTQCRFAFYSKRDLVRHVDSKHLNCRSFRCQFCDYGANTKETLNQHVWKNHDLKCSTSYPTRYSSMKSDANLLPQATKAQSSAEKIENDYEDGSDNTNAMDKEGYDYVQEPGYNTSDDTSLLVEQNNSSL